MKRHTRKTHFRVPLQNLGHYVGMCGRFGAIASMLATRASCLQSYVVTILALLPVIGLIWQQNTLRRIQIANDQPGPYRAFDVQVEAGAVLVTQAAGA